MVNWESAAITKPLLCPAFALATKKTSAVLLTTPSIPWLRSPCVEVKRAIRRPLRPFATAVGRSDRTPLIGIACRVFPLLSRHSEMRLLPSTVVVVESAPSSQSADPHTPYAAAALPVTVTVGVIAMPPIVADRTDDAPAQSAVIRTTPVQRPLASVNPLAGSATPVAELPSVTSTLLAMLPAVSRAVTSTMAESVSAVSADCVSRMLLLLALMVDCSTASAAVALSAVKFATARTVTFCAMVVARTAVDTPLPMVVPVAGVTVTLRPSALTATGTPLSAAPPAVRAVTVAVTPVPAATLALLSVSVLCAASTAVGGTPPVFTGKASDVVEESPPSSTVVSDTVYVLAVRKTVFACAPVACVTPLPKSQR